MTARRPQPAARSLSAVPTPGLLVVGFLAILLAACGQAKEGTVAPGSKAEEIAQRQGKVFGDSLSLGGPDKKSLEGEGSGSGIGVNSFLWRASLDTVAFMPVASADPFGGVIITDWYSPNAATAERFKMNVYIVGRSLRADGIRVSVFRQVIDQTGQWRDAPVAKGSGTQIEDAILTRARQLRGQSLTKK